MRVAQERVRLFQEKYGYPHPDRPTVLTSEEMEFRRRLMLEELNELEAANANGDFVGMADGLADSLYVLLGTAVYMGIDITPIFDEVHRSNMTKDVSRDGINKPIKGPGFMKPRIAELLVMQVTGLDDVVL